MNLERLLRDVDLRLSGCAGDLRETVQDAIREAVAREQRAAGPSATIETERERRLEAEQMREILEAIDRPASTEEALAEAVQHSARALDVDAVLIACREQAGYRVLTALGDEEERLAGRILSGPSVDVLDASSGPTVVEDVEAPGAAACPVALGLRSWVALPVLHQGDRIGLLLLGRRAAPVFTEDGLRRARHVAFAVAAMLARHRREEQLRRYALMLEQLMDLDQRVFRGEAPELLLQSVAEAACSVGDSRGGFLIVQTPHGPEVAAAVGEAFAPAVGRAAPAALASAVPRQLGAERIFDIAEVLGVTLPFGPLCLVPLATAERYVGCLALLDDGSFSASAPLVEAFASRAAVALRFALSNRPRE